MKIFHLMVLCTLINLPTQKDSFEIYDIKNRDEYTFYYTKSVTDTVVFIANSKLVNSCASSAKFISRRNLSTTSELITKKGYINFTYTAPALSCAVKTVTAGSGQPGRKDTEYVHTYSTYPYLIEDCSAFR